MHRIMPLIREKSLFMAIIRFILKIGHSLDERHLLTSLEAASGIVDTEDYTTYKCRYVSSVADAEELVQLKLSHLVAYTHDVSKKRLVRPLLSCIEWATRTYKI